MAYMKNFDSFNEYYEFNKMHLQENPLLNFFIIETIERVNNNETIPIKGFNVIDDSKGHNITVLLVTEVCLIYGNEFTDDMIELLSTQLEFKRFRKYQFAGSKLILDALFKLNNASYKLEKHRIIYKCQKVKEDFEYAPGEMQTGDLNRIKELANFSKSFVKFYDGQEISQEEARIKVASGIMHNNFYQWVYKQNICAIAQDVNVNYSFPVIGHLYTNPAFRNQGFASSIVHKLTKQLLNNGNAYCMLVADAKNPFSNKAFISVGYLQTGEYVRAWKNK